MENKVLFRVIPAEAGIQSLSIPVFTGIDLDSRFHGNDKTQLRFHQVTPCTIQCAVFHTVISTEWI
jgi:hypothetical protein